MFGILKRCPVPAISRVGRKAFGQQSVKIRGPVLYKKFFNFMRIHAEYMFVPVTLIARCFIVFKVKESEIF
jgi:hypothetical protein